MYSVAAAPTFFQPSLILRLPLNTFTWAAPKLVMDMGKPNIMAMGPSSLLSRVKAFLPELQQANTKLEDAMASNPATDFDIEQVRGRPSRLAHTVFGARDCSLQHANLCNIYPASCPVRPLTAPWPRALVVSQHTVFARIAPLPLLPLCPSLHTSVLSTARVSATSKSADTKA